ncbi:CsgG/HfaB family protein [Desulfurobacterium sp.]
MKKSITFLSVFILSAAFVAGCGGTTTTVVTTPQNINAVASYKGKKARIAVLSFKCKAAKCNGRIGSGISEMLQDALMRTGKFIVLERGGEISAIQSEKEFGAPVGPSGGAFERADIAVTGAVVAFEPNAGGFGIGVGGFLPKVPLLGGVKIGTKEAYIAAIIKLVDVRTGRILSSTRVEGKASSFSVGGLGGSLFGKVPLGVGLEEYKNTPMEKAVMVMIDNAVKAIAQNIPEDYYRYSSNGESVEPLNSPSSNQQVEAAGGSSVQESAGETIGKVFTEDFEKYGLGQMAPFGSWQGKDAKVVQSVQINGRIGKVLELSRGGKVCLTGKTYKDFDVAFDKESGGYKSVGIIFRASENPSAGYEVTFYASNKVAVYKFAGSSRVKVAENRFQPKPVNGWYRVRLTVKGNRIEVFVDDKGVIDITDNDPALNGYGFICLKSRDVDPVKVDNVKIVDLE